LPCTFNFITGSKVYSKVYIKILGVFFLPELVQ